MSEQMQTFDQWWTEIEGFSFRGQRLCELLNKPSLAQVAYDEGVAAALATQPQAPQEGGWQPIETAPTMKDVLACNPCGFVGRAHKDTSGRWNHIGNPTHWMPFPAAPTKTPEVQK